MPGITKPTADSFTEKDATVLKNIELPKKPVIVEIGSGRGGSTQTLGRIAQKLGGVVFTIDLVDYVDRHFKTVGLPVVFIKGNSFSLRWDVIKIDLLFVDGDHEAAKKDLEKWGRFVKKGGYITGHDFLYSDGVREAVAEFCSKYSLDHWVGGNVFVIKK